MVGTSDDSLFSYGNIISLYHSRIILIVPCFRFTNIFFRGTRALVAFHFDIMLEISGMEWIVIDFITTSYSLGPTLSVNRFVLDKLRGRKNIRMSTRHPLLARICALVQLKLVFYIVQKAEEIYSTYRQRYRHDIQFMMWLYMWMEVLQKSPLYYKMSKSIWHLWFNL